MCLLFFDSFGIEERKFTLITFLSLLMYLRFIFLHNLQMQVYPLIFEPVFASNHSAIL